jgi:phospholipase C
MVVALFMPVSLWAQSSTVLVLNSPLNPSTYGQLVAISATLPTGATGGVTFQIDGGAAISAPDRTLDTRGLTTGSHTITASYAGDANFLPATASLSQYVFQQTGSVSLASSLNPSLYGQPVAIQATLPNGATGGVTFQIDGGSAISAPDRTIDTSSLTAGSHTITVSYAGDIDYGFASASLTQTVNQATGSVSLASSLNPSTYGQPVAIKATLPPGATGGVTFQVDGGPAIPAPDRTLDTSSLTAGSHTITVSFPGDTDFGTASSSLTQTVNQATGSVSLASSLNPSLTGQLVAIKATLPPGATGGVTFQIDGGAAIPAPDRTLDTSMLTSGTHTIVASYSGDNNYTAASAATFSQIVYAAPTQASSSSYGATATQFHSVSSMTSLSAAQKLALLQANIKYVFVIFQENRSYDHYFGTFPGANGLFATYPNANPSDPSALPGNAFVSFNSVIQTVNSSPTVTYSSVSPFLVPRQIVNQSGATTLIYPEDMLSVDHSHTGYINDFHSDQATRSIPQNDGYPLDQEGLYYNTDASGTSAAIYSASTHATPTSQVTLQAKQKGEIVMGHIDCDTIPFLWQYADRFTMFDNMHQTATGPSTPNAIAMIGAQTGDTQWVLHPNNYDSYSITYGSPSAVPHAQYTLPNETDSAPFAGSASDNAAVKPPFGPDETSGQSPTTIGTPRAGQETLTFASLPLSFMGSQIDSITASDQHSAFDLADVQQDMATIMTSDPNIPWGWYQQGYGAEPFDGTAVKDDENIYTAIPEHASYIVHHNGPQYFGYLGDNTQEQANMHGLQQFYTDVASSALSPTGGVYYIRGGYYNNLNQTPLDPNALVEQDFAGNDDHGSYSDSQISEAMVATTVNAIANSPYWNQSAIIITYDESDGFFDHQPEQFRTYGPDGQPETGGPRIPLIMVSPFAVTHGVSHTYSEHSSVIRFVEELEGLVPLGQLPNEAAAFTAGANLCTTPPTYSGSTVAPTLVKPGGQATSTTINPFCLPNGSPQTALGPADVYTGMGDLTEAFDNDRLLNNVSPLPASYVTIPTATVTTLPHYNATGACSNSALNIVPTDYKNGVYNSAAFDPTGAQTAVPVIDPPPADFNPRPTVSNGSPFYNTGNNTTTNSPTGTGSPWLQ